MSQVDWHKLIADASCRYEVLDSTVALIGNPTSGAAEAKPFMLLRVRHVESLLEMTFLFDLSQPIVDTLANTLAAMADDMEDNKPLDEHLTYMEDDDDEI